MKNKIIKSICILLAVLMPALILTSCGSDADSVTIEGVVADHNGYSAEGLTFVFLDTDSNDYSASIGEGGKFTAYSVPVGTTLAVSVEDSDGNGLAQVSYFTITNSDKTEMLMNGANISSSLGINRNEKADTVYISFYLDDNSLLNMSYCSDECPESESPTTAQQSTTAPKETTSSAAIF